MPDRRDKMNRSERTVIRIIGTAMLVIACLFSFDVWLRVVTGIMAFVLIVMS